MSALDSYRSIGDCEICSRLSDVETSFAKFGWEEGDRPLPPAAGQLEPSEPLDSYDRQRDHIRRCPSCGVFYHYQFSYEYLVNGSEDEEILTRLTPSEAASWIDPPALVAWLDHLPADLAHPSPLSRRYAAMSLVYALLERGAVSQAETYLSSPDVELVTGALAAIRRRVESAGEWSVIATLHPALERLSGSVLERTALPARYLLDQASRQQPG